MELFAKYKVCRILLLNASLMSIISKWILSTIILSTIKNYVITKVSIGILSSMSFWCQKLKNISSPLFVKKNTIHKNNRILGAMIEAVVNFSQDYE